MSVNLFIQGKDNWGYLLSNKLGEALAVDPLDDALYEKKLAEKKLRLVGILATHYHADHIEGIPALLSRHSVPVIGPDTDEAPPFVTRRVLDEDFSVEGFDFESSFLPGHSRSHCVYLEKKKQRVFVGDVLFHLGCGRVLDCDPKALFASLQRLKEFPMGCELFVGHDYRKKNHAFCQQLDSQYYSALNASDLDSSTTLEMELWWNPFLRTASYDEWWDLRQRRNKFS